MITSTKNYSKKVKKKYYSKKTKQNKTKTDRQNPRTNGKSKAIQTKSKSHTEAYTYTLTKREKGKKIYISLLPKSTSSIWDDLLSIQVFHRCRVHQVDCGDLICCS